MGRREVAYWCAVWTALGILVGCSSAPSPPPPSVTVGTGVKLPKGCSPDKVAAIVSGFLRALNEGDELAALKYFGDGFQWYSAPAGGTEERRVDSVFTIRDVDPYLAARISQHEQMQLHRIGLTGGSHLGTTDFTINLNRTADDLKWGAGNIVGKGAVNCGAGTIVAWSLGEAPLAP